MTNYNHGEIAREIISAFHQQLCQSCISSHDRSTFIHAEVVVVSEISTTSPSNEFESSIKGREKAIF